MKIRNRREGPLWVEDIRRGNVMLRPGEEADVSPQRYARESPYYDNLGALHGVRRIMFIGASIMEYAFNSGSDDTDLIDLCKQSRFPLDAVVPQTAVPGDTLEDILSSLPANLAKVTGRDDVLVIVHAPGNTVRDVGPYPNGEQEIREGMESICQQVINAGHKLLLMPLTYRRFQETAGRETAAYNRHIHYPLMRQYCPDFWDEETQKPVFDLWQWFYDFRSLINSDDVHPDRALRGILRALLAKRLGEVYNEVKPATAADYSGRSIIVNFGYAREPFDNINASIFPNEGSSSTTGIDCSACCSGLIDTTGAHINGPWVRAFGFTNPNDAGSPEKGVDGVTDVNNTLAVRDSIYTGNTSVFEVAVANIPDGLTGTVTVTGTRSTGTERKLWVWQDGKQWDHAIIDAVTPDLDIHSIRFESYGGMIRLMCQKEQDSQFGYLSVARFDFD